LSDDIRAFFESLPEQAASADLAGVRASYVFEIAGSAWTVRIADGGLTVSEGIEEGVDCTISTSEETFRKLLGGQTSAMAAYLSGKLKLRGDLGAALQLQRLLG
jgi:putative sterol carrier protein